MLPRNKYLLAGIVIALLLVMSGANAEEKTTFSLIKFYQTYISPVDGDRCPMTPSCSQYTKDAIEKHGLIKGWVMGCDRVVRCGRDTCKHVPSVKTGDSIQYHDPVEANDFWWFQKVVSTRTSKKSEP